MIVAWDVSVGSASSAATLIPGRLYCNNFNGNVSGTDNSASPLNVTFYVLTNVGYVYRVNTNGQNGKGFNFFINNKGVQSSSTGIANPDSITTKSWKNGLPSYKSLEYSNYKSQTYMYDPRLPDNGSEDVTHKIFFNTPALDLPTSASIRYNGVAPTISTWLRYAVDYHR